MTDIQDWHKKAVVYQIYPRSFKDSNGDGIGDLPGIIEKLDYLVELGVEAIWISPIYPSPMADFGYDISDYENIDPMFGTLDDFDKLVEECHTRGIKLMMDFVPNHTSSQHKWFLESRAAKDTPKHDWYIWRDPAPGGGPPNNWLSVFGGSAWEYDEKLNQYYLHSFDKEQPDLNWRNIEVVEKMLDVIRFWLRRGVDGFRMDAVYFMFKDDRFLDEPINPSYMVGKHEPWDALLHPYTFAQQETLEMLKQFGMVMEEFQHKFYVTEVYALLPELMKMYKLIDKHWYAPFNFGLVTLPWTVEAHRNYIDEYDGAVGHVYLPTNVLGNHDKPRIASRVGRAQARVAAMLLLTLRGMPYVYYGDELGMKDGVIPRDKVVDPWEKNMPGLGLGRDPERTPMLWDGKEQAGFSTVEPWLPVNEDYKETNYEVQKDDPKSMYALYKKLIHFRKTSTGLLYGVYQSLDCENEHVFTFTRTHKNQQLLIALNYSNEAQVVTLDDHENGQLVCSTHMDRTEGEEIETKKLTLRPNEGIVVELL